jgi:leucyl aminopeptidase
MTRIKIVSSGSLKAGDTLCLLTFQDKTEIAEFPWSGSLERKILALARKDGFKGKEGQCAVVRPLLRGIPERIVLIGLGKKEEVCLDSLRTASAVAAKKARELEIPALFLRPAFLENREAANHAAVEGALLGAYRYTKHITVKDGLSKPLQTLNLVFKNISEKKALQAGAPTGRVYAECVNFVRDLVNDPAADKPPETMALIASRLAGRGTQVRVYKAAEMTRMKMGGLLGVGRGSSRPPAFVHLHYKPSRGPVKRRVGLAGKGITFDSGGLSLKPAEAMETMKTDMAGAAAVMGVFRALALLKPPVEVQGFLAFADNMPGSNAAKPGDVFHIHKGKSVEVLNTDAEGRLVLADALSFASNQDVDEIIDIATLTGACVVALGNAISGMMGNDEDLIERLKNAGAQSGEKLWPLPLEKEYREQIKSRVADLKNISSRREAGAIIGGLFLQEFVRSKPWVHIDIAGPAWAAQESALQQPGGTGVMVRTILRYLSSL